MEINRLSNFTRFFEVEGANFIVASIYWDTYADLDSLIVFNNNLLSIYLSKTQIDRTNNLGLKFISKKDVVENYVRNFSEFINSSYDEFKLLTSLQTKNSVKSFFERIFRFFDYYRMTEFFYTDSAYLLNDKKIQKNLQKIGTIKTQGRKLLNSIFLGSNSYINKLIDKLSKEYSIPTNKLLYYSYLELVNLFEKGDTVDDRELEKRIKHYLLLNLPKRKCIHDLKTINQYSVNKQNGNTIYGKTANIGIIEGIARVIEPNYDNFDRTFEFIKMMVAGEILIAESTSPELTIACRKAAAIVTNQGGIGSHGAIISREFNIPCIVGTRDATRRIKTGDYIRVSAQIDSGEVVILKSA